MEKTRMKFKEFLAFVFKLLILKLIYIGYFCLLIGVGKYNGVNSFAQYSKLNCFLISITIMLVFAPLVYLLYKVRPFFRKTLNDAFRWFICLYTFIMINIVVIMLF